MGRSNKKIRKDIRGHERVIEVHRQKISIELDNPYPNKQALQDWQKHIRIG